MSEQQTNDVTAGSVPAQIPNFELNKTACCYFLKEKEQGTMIKLNDSSALIWQVCTGEWEVGEIIDVLKENYPDAADSMEKDVYQALDLLISEGAVELTS
jgi:hypothetical protein